MSKNIFILLTIFLSLIACKNANQKEIGEVDGLISMVDEIEKSILSVDTSRAFAAKRQIAKDLKFIEGLNDTLDKKTAFMLGDFYAGKKTIYRFSSNYNSFITQVDYAKKQLADLKQDLNNGLITEEKFDEYYKAEQAALLELNMQVNKSVNGIEEVIQKLDLDRNDINELFEELAKKKNENGE